MLLSIPALYIIPKGCIKMYHIFCDKLISRVGEKIYKAWEKQILEDSDGYDFCFKPRKLTVLESSFYMRLEREKKKKVIPEIIYED